MSTDCVHLHVHSDYSIVDGLMRIEALADCASQLQMPALAITERGNMYSAVKFYKAMQKRGIKPIIGSELTIIPDKKNSTPVQIVLLCMHQQGYRHLTRLITKSYVDEQRHTSACLPVQDLYAENAGLIALSGRDGDVGKALLARDQKSAKYYLRAWQKYFPDRFYLQVERLSYADEAYYIPALVDLAIEHEVPLVASNNVLFASPDDYAAHEVRSCIQQGRVVDDTRRPMLYRPTQYLRSAADMAALFADLPQALTNTVKIAQRCNLVLALDETHLPYFPVPDGSKQETLLREQIDAGLHARILQLQQAGQNPDLQRYKQRLDSEFTVISSMGFAGYFLIVADFIDWAKSQQIPVGPGRGSGAGSLAAYVLGITELDPIAHDLLFERFLNPERVSLPDFDIDFCMDRRDEVIAYVAARYGADHVSQIITHGTMAAKAVIRDVGRALGYPYGFVDQLARLIPFEPDMTLAKALAMESALQERYQNEPDVKILIDVGQKLEGLVRNAGRHAGGIVIAPQPLTHYMPLYRDPGSGATVTQFDMDDVASIGLVKFDFLGLRTLTIIDWAVQDINRRRMEENTPLLDIREIKLDSRSVYKLIKKTETVSIFQLESDGMRKLIKRLQPDSFDDLTALVALFRPGPLQSGMVDDFIDRKHGKVEVQYPHPALAPVLKTTYGVILYQEQVMKIAQVLAGYSLGNADLLRRAMGKKDPAEMAKQRAFFIEGATKNGVSGKRANFIFDLMEKFAGYGFNKSHSAAYALLAYQTAWLKSHYPAAFMAAVLSSDMDNTDKIMLLRDELIAMRIPLLGPDINHSCYQFIVEDKSQLRFGLGAIKGAGKSAVESIISERSAHGEFTDFIDFCCRIDLRKIHKGVLESLIKSGAMDGLWPSRSSLFHNVDKAVRFAEQFHRNRDTGQHDLFGLTTATMQSETSEQASFSLVLDEVTDWSEETRLVGEKETLGFYLQGHPIMRYEQELDALGRCKLQALQASNTILVAAYIMGIRTRMRGKGRMAEVKLDDRSGRGLLLIYPEVFQQYRHLLLKDHLILIRGAVGEDKFYGDYQYSIRAKSIYTLDAYRQEFAQLSLFLSATILSKDGLSKLKDLLQPYRTGGCRVIIRYQNDMAQGDLLLGDSWQIAICDELLDALRQQLGSTRVRLEYP